MTLDPIRVNQTGHPTEGTGIPIRKKPFNYLFAVRGAGLPNLLWSIATFVLMSRSSIELRPSSHA
jgi:hypothetical protein